MRSVLQVIQCEVKYIKGLCDLYYSLEPILLEEMIVRLGL